MTGPTATTTPPAAAPAAPCTTILVVEDNQGLTGLIEKYLRREGFRTAPVSSGAAALDWLTRQRATLMLIDLKLPDMSGEELINELAARGREVPFLVVTAHGDERGAVQMMKRGALDYLMKDGTLLELLPAVVRQALDQLERQRRLREAEVAYEHLRRHYEMILQAAGEGICGIDLQGRITFVNPAGLRLLGYEAGELLGQDLATLAERPDAGRNGHVRDALAANTTCRRHDQEFWRKDGSSFPIEYTSTPIRENGRQIGAVFVFRDVTQRRALEEQFRQSQKLEAVGRLAGGVAHDFNNLLTVISGYSELMVRNPSFDQRARDSAGEIHKAAERAIALTRQLLAFSRKQLLQPRRLSLNAVISEIHKLLCRLIGEDVHLHLALAADLAPVTADPGQLEQVILNLAVNARDAMPQGGVLTVATANVVVDALAARNQPDLPPGRYALLAVSDTGCGMDEATKVRVFEPFFTTKGVGQGTGLGLATVYGIVVQSGGRIDVQSEPGRGTTFRVLLPQTAGTVEPAPAPPPAEALPRGGTETILLVEDEDAVRELAARVLLALGYMVVAARDGAEAQQIAQQANQFLHLMVTDVVMPGISGLELARRLAPVRPKMKVLFLSGYADDTIVKHGPLGPGAAFLQKPFTPDGLARTVREVLDRAAVEGRSGP